MAGIGDYKKGGKFTLRSGNSPLPFKNMGSSPVKHEDKLGEGSNLGDKDTANAHNKKHADGWTHGEVGSKDNKWTPPADKRKTEAIKEEVPLKHIGASPMKAKDVEVTGAKEAREGREKLKQPLTKDSPEAQKYAPKKIK